MIPGLNTSYSLAYSLYDARPLMTEHHCAVSLVPVVAKVYVGTADARGDEANQNFIVPGLSISTDSMFKGPPLLHGIAA